MKGVREFVLTAAKRADIESKTLPRSRSRAIIEDFMFADRRNVMTVPELYFPIYSITLGLYFIVVNV